jgi:hypothetical protein
MENDILKEENYHTCKVCLKLKKRTQDGKFNEKDKRWMDEDGLLWSGKVCGSCNRDRARETMRKARARKEFKKDII